MFTCKNPHSHNGLHVGFFTWWSAQDCRDLFGGSRCLLVIPVITSCVFYFWSPVTLTCTGAIGRPLHLLGCRWCHRGGPPCLWSIRWSCLWIKLYDKFNWIRFASLTVFINSQICCSVLSFIPSGSKRGGPPGGTSDSSDSGGGVSLLNPVGNETKGHCKRHHTYCSLCNPTVNTTKPKNISFWQGHWVCLSLKITNFF